MKADGAFQSAVRRVVLEVTGRGDRVRVTHTLATLGWGDVLFVDVYARSGPGSRAEDLDPELRKTVAVVAEQPYERVAIRWRISA